MMQSTWLILLWRRKLSALLIGSSLVLFVLWTWVFFISSSSDIPTDGQFNDLIQTDNPQKHVYLLQKLISQANRVLRHQQQQQHNSATSVERNLLRSRGPTGGIPVPAAAHSGKNSGIVRFVKPTKSPPSVAIPEASEQTLSLVARRKKIPVVGGNYLFEEERLKILENQQRVRNAGMEDFQSNMDYDRVLTSAERQAQYEHELQRFGVPAIAGIGPDGPRAPNERLVHLDLKGAPPKLSFLKRLLPMLKRLGATGLLIEYEDMFPYAGVLQELSARNAYKAEELKDFLETAAMHGLSIMPLIQTFGHIEFALKLPRFEHMREISESPQSICPSQQDSIAFIQNMLTQVIEFHLSLNGAATNSNSSSTVAQATFLPSDHSNKFTHIHIGCDEVARMGECNLCRQHARNEIFLSHVTTIANFVRTHWPQLQVVIWDDMLRGMMLSEMHHSHIGNYVEPMVWVYANDIYRFIQPQLWDMYSKVFPTVWAASAFKGAFGESLMIPPLQRHLENNIRWLAVVAKEGGRFSKGIRGLTLTGWQRYDHFAVLCELLPVGIPSLITSLSTVSKGHFITNPKENDILRILECAFHPDSRRSGHPWIELHPNSHHSQLFSSCTYPGSMVYKYALRLFDKLVEVQNYLLHVKEQSAWMSDYNVRHNFSSPLRVRELTINTPNYLNELSGMAREAHEVMYEVFDDYTIVEFVEQNIYPTIAKLQRQLEHAQSLMQRRVWPQRPLPYGAELVELNLVPLQLLNAAGTGAEAGSNGDMT
ncbi:hexosaminidase D isoform X2 [Rhagoletis pomonella]|uniref:hexosaminidase D isoform X2 n=1 Tax=Rhagoletis pomonella TaxID=28610 RepID=UPI0017841DEB|nr:hexosaminidase D isoform X2 [Rhagoletis pomonella]